nr:hypothetical protein Iba_chr04dCG19080 [Ipomoea batatas]
MSFDEETSPPLDRLQSMAVLAGAGNFFVVFKHSPQQGYGKRHWKAKLHIVIGVVENDAENLCRPGFSCQGVNFEQEFGLGVVFWIRKAQILKWIHVAVALPFLGVF